MTTPRTNPRVLVLGGALIAAAFSSTRSATGSATGSAAGFLLDGWSWRERWGTWSAGRAPSLIVPVPRGYRGKLRIALWWFAGVRWHRQATVHLAFDRSEFHVVFADSECREDSFEVVADRDWILVRMRIEAPPENHGRLLRIGLIAMRLTDPNASTPAAPGPCTAP